MVVGFPPEQVLQETRTEVVRLFLICLSKSYGSVLLILLVVSELWGESRLSLEVMSRGRHGSLGGNLYHCLPQSPNH